MFLCLRLDARPLIRLGSAVLLFFPLLIAAGISPLTGGAALLLGCSMGGELFNPASVELLTLRDQTGRTSPEPGAGSAFRGLTSFRLPGWQKKSFTERKSSNDSGETRPAMRWLSNWFGGKLSGEKKMAALTPGAQAPQFELPVLDSNGKTLKLSDLKGKAVVLNFWATYCVPCKTEMPWLVQMQKAENEIKALGHDQHFLRNWEFYLGICAATFEVSRTDVVQVELAHS